MAKPFVNVLPPSAEPIYHVDENLTKQKNPVIGITYLQANNKEYGLKAIVNKEKKHSQSAIKPLHDFLVKARQYKTIEELITNHISHNRGKNCDKESKQMIGEIRRQYNVAAEEMIHIHCLRGGKGEFVLHGFVIENRFEIVWFDPDHKHYK